VNLSRTFRVGCACAVLVTAVAGCHSTPTSPSSASFTQTDLRIGTGSTAASTSTVTVNYTGWLYDASKTDGQGLQFDSTVGSSPLTFTLGAGSVIAGWDQGIPGMRVGGVRRLIIPPSLGYGSARYAVIPPNSTLVFDVELVSIQ
jgi:FKBP-type peptidyl-prolyl cis-trans isomerase FkpA